MVVFPSEWFEIVLSAPKGVVIKVLILSVHCAHECAAELQLNILLATY